MEIRNCPPRSWSEHLRSKAQEILTSHFGPFGPIKFPYTVMGKVDSLDLFGPNELIIFAFYWANRERYTRVLDIGANLGLHSILMSKLHWEVKAFEPDPSIYSILETDLKKNKAYGVQCSRAAVTDRDGEIEFVRVHNNLTGSYVQGSKQGYGPLTSMMVPCVDCRPLFDWAELAKLDVEGHEKTLLKCVTSEHLEDLDFICELRGKETAIQVRNHFIALDAEIYSQKHDWKPARHVEHLPVTHQEGSIFISRYHTPWPSILP